MKFDDKSIVLSSRAVLAVLAAKAEKGTFWGRLGAVLASTMAFVVTLWRPRALHVTYVTRDSLGTRDSPGMRDSPGTRGSSLRRDSIGTRGSLGTRGALWESAKPAASDNPIVSGQINIVPLM